MSPHETDRDGSPTSTTKTPMRPRSFPAPAKLAVIIALGLLGARQAAAAPPDCSSDTTLCLGERFQIVASWTAPDGRTGSGHAVSLTPDSGYFWFFDPANLEVTIKVLDGCSLNEHFWVFLAGLTNLSIDMDVTDSLTHVTKRYSNPQGTVFESAADTGSFSGCSVPSSLSSPSQQPAALGPSTPHPALSTASPQSEPVCGTSDAVLCTGGRFKIQATWSFQSGQAGTAHAVQITDQSGYFWFFDPANVEVIVKTLDACAIGSDQWFFAAGMTSALVSIEVTDTFTGETRSYLSPSGNRFQPRIDTNAFSYCPPRGSQAVALSCTPLHSRSRFCDLELSSCSASPYSVQVHVGDTVTWAWGAGEVHHITTSDGWDSGERSGPVMVSHAFSAPGSYSYECQLGFRSGSSVYSCGILRWCCIPQFSHEGGIVTVVP